MTVPSSQTSGSSALWAAAGLLASWTALPGIAHGHPRAPHAPDGWNVWTFDPVVLVPLAFSTGMYCAGVRNLWRRAGVGHGVRRWEAGVFAGGTLALFVALVSPLHRMGEALFSLHMMQHAILLLVAAPMLAFGRPLIAFVWALPLRARRAVGRATRWPAVRIPWHFLSGPASAWILHAVALWLWHAPVLYQATLGSDAVHALQHVSFVAAGLLFWHVVDRSRRRARTAGAIGLFVFTTAAHASLLGALLTYAPAPLYPVYAGRTEPWGLSLLEDQQIGGMIMWVPGGVVYVLAAVALFATWLQHFGRRRRAPWRPIPSLEAADGE